jgi:hypothetical protein
VIAARGGQKADMSAPPLPGIPKGGQQLCVHIRTEAPIWQGSSFGVGRTCPPCPPLRGGRVMTALDHRPGCDEPTPTVAGTIIAGIPYLFIRCPECGAQALDPADPDDRGRPT